MKRAICIFLCLLVLLTGCEKKNNAKTVTFCYRRVETIYGSADGILAEEERSVTGQPEDLASMLTLYLQGPESEELTLPIPHGTQLIDYCLENEMLTVTFSSHLAQLDGMDLTVACACIAATCFNLTDAQQVQIRTPDNSTGSGIFLSMSRNSLLIYDDVTESTTNDLP